MSNVTPIRPRPLDAAPYNSAAWDRLRRQIRKVEHSAEILQTRVNDFNKRSYLSRLWFVLRGNTI